MQVQAGHDRPTDRLRELLDAVLDEGNRSLEDMAGDAYASPFHFSRQLSREDGLALPDPDPITWLRAHNGGNR